MSPARVTIFAQRVAHTIVECEIAIAHQDDFGDMKVPPPLLEPYWFVRLLTLGRTQLFFLARTWDALQETSAHPTQCTGLTSSVTLRIRVLRESAPLSLPHGLIAPLTSPLPRYPRR